MKKQRKIKSDNFFVISNFNTDPEPYLEYCNNYHIYDQSTQPEVASALKEKYSKISFVPNSGHNISDYFRFFIENYDNLPNRMLLGKGNMIGRHISQDYFERVYNNNFYTMLYNDRSYKDVEAIAYQLYDGGFLEINNSWYGLSKPNKYFRNFNKLLSFIFKNPVISKWILFSPGACYIINKEQVLKYPKSFYENMMHIITYTYFPSEAYMIERMLHIIFSGIYELNDHVIDSNMFYTELEKVQKSDKYIGLDNSQTILSVSNRLKTYFRRFLFRRRQKSN